MAKHVFKPGDVVRRLHSDCADDRGHRCRKTGVYVVARLTDGCGGVYLVGFSHGFSFDINCFELVQKAGIASKEDMEALYG